MTADPAFCLAAARAAPLDPAPWVALGLALREQGRPGEAEEALRTAVALAPRDASARNALGVALRALGRPEAALAEFAAALEARPDFADARLNAAAVLDSLDRAGEAEAHCRAVLAREPASAAALYGLGNALSGQDRLEEAIPAFRAAAALEPWRADVLTNLGVALQGLAEARAALAVYDAAVAAAPQAPEARFDRGLSRLMLGRLAEGFEDYEARWRVPGFPTPPRDLPHPWDGRPLPGGTLLLHAEQGLGDTLQFVRFARAARRLCGRVVLECQPPLERLLAEGGVAGVDLVVAAGRPLPAFDAQAPLLGLPRLLGVAGLADIPAATPYLRPPGPLPERLRLPPAPFRVGLVWQGSPAFRFNHVRCFPFTTLRPLLDLPGVAFHALQMGPAAAEREPPVADLAPLIGDMGDTAHLLAQLDLVIGVDTGVIHLAGALGRPTWVLLARSPDFRWLEDRGDSPWYPGMRLFRQPRRADWASVVRAVREALSVASNGAIC